MHERICCKTAVQTVKTTGDSPESSLRNAGKSTERENGRIRNKNVQAKYRDGESAAFSLVTDATTL